MNPDAQVMNYLTDRYNAESRVRQDRKAALHRKAVQRRRKAKNGGKR